MTSPDRRFAIARRALGTLIVKEASVWGRGHAVWSQPAIFLALTAGGLTLPLSLLRDVLAAEPGGVLGGAASVLSGLLATAPAIAAVLWFQNALIGERQSGTAAWVLSKPVPRWTMPASKLIVHGGGTLLAGVVLPGALAWGVLATALPSAPPLGAFAAALAVLALHATFYAALALALGASFDARGVVVAVPLVLLLGGDLALSALPAAARATPWLLGRGAGAMMQGAAFPLPEAIAATATWTVALLALAFVRFGRRDL